LRDICRALKVGALGAGALAAALATAPAYADTLVDNVRGITVQPGQNGAAGSITRFTGLLIGNDGRITLLLHEGEKRPRADYAMDAHGAVLLPGLIDAHVHVMDLGFAALTLNLSGTKSLAEAQGRIAAYAAAHPDRPWILGTGWNQEAWGLKDAAGRSRFPTAAEIDAVVADRPVWLTRVDGHAGWANSRAMALAGVNSATQAPEGGRIERPTPLAGKPGRPGGVFVDAAQALITAHVPPPRPEDRDLALATAQAILLRHGVTAVCDMATTIEDWQAFRRAGDTGRLQIRIMAYADGVDNMVLIGGPGPSPWLYDDHLRLNGVKFFVDGALGSRGAWLKAAYADAPGNTGLQRLSDTQLRNLMSRAAIDHFQVAVHAIGDAANARVLDAIEQLAGTYTGDRRWRIEHAQIFAPEDLARFGPLAARAGGIIASMQPAQQTSDAAMAEARLGDARLAGAYAWQSLSAAGAVLAFGSDAPVEVPDPFAGLAAAITRQDANGLPPGGWQPQERISPAAALAAYTTGAAWAGFAEGRIGHIAPGLGADFVLVDQDPLTASPAAIRATRVLGLWVGGRQVVLPAPLPH